MCESLWLGGLLIANLWAAGVELQAVERPVGTACTPKILPPLKPGERATCDQIPTNQEILRAIPRVQSVPGVHEVFRDDIEIASEKLVDRIDGPRFYPLIGPAQHHRCHWKCTVYFTEAIESSYPFSFLVKRRCTEVVYMEKDQLYLCFGENEKALAEVTAEMLGVPLDRKPTDPSARMEQLLVDSDNLRNVPPECRRGANSTTPAAETPYRIYGGARAASAALGDEPIEPRPVEATEGSRQVYVIIHDGGKAEKAIALSAQPGLTVLDAISQTNNARVAVTAKIWVTRPSASGEVILPVDWKAILQSGRTDTNFQLLSSDRLHIEVSAPVVAVANREIRRAAMSLADVATMAKLGIADDIIVRQMEIENAVFDLTAADIIRLHQAGASERVIRAMQGRRTTTEAPAIIPAGGLHERSAPRVPNQMSVAELVRLKEIGTPEESILHLIDATRSLFDLAEAEPVLRRHGFSETTLNVLRVRMVQRGIVRFNY